MGQCKQFVCNVRQGNLVTPDMHQSYHKHYRHRLSALMHALDACRKAAFDLIINLMNLPYN